MPVLTCGLNIKTCEKFSKKIFRTLDHKINICYIVRQEKQDKMDANYILRTAARYIDTISFLNQAMKKLLYIFLWGLIPTV
jgi:hypothetical protein